MILKPAIRPGIRDQIKRYKKPHYSPHKFHYKNLSTRARRSDRTVDETANALRQRRLRTVSLILRLPYRTPLPFSPPTELDNHCRGRPIVQIIHDPYDHANTETTVKKTTLNSWASSAWKWRLRVLASSVIEAGISNKGRSTGLCALG